MILALGWEKFGTNNYKLQLTYFFSNKSATKWRKAESRFKINYLKKRDTSVDRTFGKTWGNFSFRSAEQYVSTPSGRVSNQWLRHLYYGPNNLNQMKILKNQINQSDGSNMKIKPCDWLIWFFKIFNFSFDSSYLGHSIRLYRNTGMDTDTTTKTTSPLIG